jgi:cardiolipin synthase
MEAMLLAIEQARHSVRLEMYIYTASPIGERFREALRQAAQRGLEVKVLLDSWGCLTLSERFWEPLRQAGGEVRRFNPLSLGRCGIRNHRKLLVCDESVGFVGGFNISSEYQGDGVKRGWFDLGLRVEGSVARELASSFDDLYALAEFKHRLFARFRKSVAQKIISHPEGQIILAGPGHDRHFLKSILLNDVRSAKCIQIIAAYFLPLRPIRRALLRAARRSNRVQIVVAAKSDVPILQLACQRFYHAFLRAGVEIYEYQPQVLHAKLILADRVVYAGSANLDRRSFLANYELLLRLTQPEVTVEAREIFEATLRHCRRIEMSSWKKSRSFWNKLMERWAFLFLARVDSCLSRRQLRNLR